MSKEKRRVLVVQGDQQIESMFADEGWEVIRSAEKHAHLVCFTGGEDVTPFLYGEKPLAIDGKQVTHFNPLRDMHEIKCFHTWSDVPKVGICRGAQFLNVMSGGRLFQHVTDHALAGTHKMKYISGYKDMGKGKQYQPIWKEIDVTSTHHQMMIPGDMGETVGTAGVATRKYTEDNDKTFPEPHKYDMDVEAVHYWHNNTLCYQPHPEYVAKTHACQRTFFEMIESRLFNRK